MARNALSVLLGITILLVSCSQPTRTQNVALIKSTLLRDRVAAPDPKKYSTIRDARDWQNPYLIVRANGIDARTTSAATEGQEMSPSDVVAYLERLPPIAWPYGLVVAVQGISVRSPGDDAPIQKNREELLLLLEKAGIKVNLWPS